MQGTLFDGISTQTCVRKPRPKDPGSRRAYYERNKKRIIAQAMAWKKRNKDRTNEIQRKHRRTHLGYYSKQWRKYWYGLSDEQFNALLDQQVGCCAVCRIRFCAKVRLCVDHSHVTGKVRGLLCDQCNKGIGHFCDNPEVLRAAAEYLSR